MTISGSIASFETTDAATYTDTVTTVQITGILRTVPEVFSESTIQFIVVILTELDPCLTGLTFEPEDNPPDIMYIFRGSETPAQHYINEPYTYGDSDCEGMVANYVLPEALNPDFIQILDADNDGIADIDSDGKFTFVVETADEANQGLHTVILYLELQGYSFNSLVSVTK